ncbi:Bug family tripartite tricarboxylate transporter substrate binding protein [Cupriavidus necator]
MLFRAFLPILLFMSMLGAPASTQAQQPRAIHLIVAFAPGSGSDLLARSLAPPLSAALGAPVVVENRPGADGAIAAEYVAGAKPDGQTILVGTQSTHAANPHLRKSLSYDPLKDFAPIGRLGRTYLVLVARPGLGDGTLPGLIRAARAKPDGLSFAAGTASARIAAEQFRMVAKVPLTHVPYKGIGPALADLVAGHADFTFADSAAAQSLIQAGRLKAIAVTSPARLQQLPAVPTVREAGVAELEFMSWSALFAPAGTPSPVVMRLHDAMLKALRSPEVVALFEKGGFVLDPTTPEELSRFVHAEYDKWRRVIEFAKIQKE